MLNTIEILPAYSKNGHVRTQPEGPDDKTEFWAVYFRDDNDRAEWLEDWTKKADAESAGSNHARRLGVSMSPYPWVLRAEREAEAARAAQEYADKERAEAAARAQPAPAENPARKITPPTTPAAGDAPAQQAPDHARLDKLERQLAKSCAARGLGFTFVRSETPETARRTGIDTGARQARAELYRKNALGERVPVHAGQGDAGDAESVLKKALEAARKCELSEAEAERRKTAERAARAARAGETLRKLPLIFRVFIELANAIREDFKSAFLRPNPKLTPATPAKTSPPAAEPEPEPKATPAARKPQATPREAARKPLGSADLSAPRATSPEPSIAEKIAALEELLAEKRASAVQQAEPVAALRRAPRMR